MTSPNFHAIEGPNGMCRCGVLADGTVETCGDLLRQYVQAQVRAIWQPIATAPKMQTILLFAVTDRAEDGTSRNWKMATGYWHTGFDDGGSKMRGFTPWEWGGNQLKIYDVQPTHWMPLPSPPGV